MITKSKILFRFLFCYCFLYIFPFPFNIFEFLGFLDDWVSEAYHLIIPWIGANVLNIEEPITVFTNGSGDTTYDYVLVLFFLSSSTFATTLWTLIERKKIDYTRLNYWLLVGLRFYVGYMLLQYGMYKIIKLQFPEPSFGRLLERIGDMSPMGLVWTYMGYSKGFNLFTGLGEAIGGVLLFHRRTALLGTLINLVVLANIVAINMFFDVPVKLFSVNLCLMSLIILAPHAKRLTALILHTNIPARQAKFNLFQKGRYRLLGGIGKWTLIVFILYNSISGVYESSQQYGDTAPKPPLYGLYEFDLFVADGDTLEQKLNDARYWRYLAIEYTDRAQIYQTDMTRKWMTFEVDTLEKQIKLTERADSTQFYTFNYQKLDSTFVIEGYYLGDSIYASANVKTKQDFLLMNRGFRWINEYPFNR